ncbi:hypothetical protein CERSUDRAFT_83016 [Gelatoporia subvermispora B]|uniref:Uncharacterized protein n=1 Tax=Ceriporiopsis subvermispora (strain B) TaxID=914234 RepID=M2REK1_CERS8|nr:hypothetical protein CERSUDRAFT_83016 [Gelatoporia subvermispora B]
MTGAAHIFLRLSSEDYENKCTLRKAPPPRRSVTPEWQPREMVNTTPDARSSDSYDFKEQDQRLDKMTGSFEV